MLQTFEVTILDSEEGIAKATWNLAIAFCGMKQLTYLNVRFDSDSDLYDLTPPDDFSVSMIESVSESKTPIWKSKTPIWRLPLLEQLKVSDFPTDLVVVAPHLNHFLVLNGTDRKILDALMKYPRMNTIAFKGFDDDIVTYITLPAPILLHHVCLDNLFISLQTLQAITQSWKHLKTFEATMHENVTGTAILDFLQSVSSTLETCAIFGSGEKDTIPRVTTKKTIITMERLHTFTFRYVIHSYPHFFCLFHCPHLIDVNIPFVLLPSSQYPKLSYLHLSSNPDPADIDRDIDKCSSLKKLEFTSNSTVIVSTLINWFQHSPLQTLTIHTSSGLLLGNFSFFFGFYFFFFFFL